MERRAAIPPATIVTTMTMNVRRETALLFALDMLLVLVAWGTAFWLRFNLDVPAEFQQLAWHSAPWTLIAFALGLAIARVYRHVWRYIGLPELRQLGAGVLLGAVLSATAVLMLRYPNFPRSVLLLQPLLVLVFLGSVRAAWRPFPKRSACPCKAYRYWAVLTPWRRLRAPWVRRRPWSPARQDRPRGAMCCFNPQTRP
jgi:hypothetical protein